jgi:hypothetical protein
MWDPNFGLTRFSPAPWGNCSAQEDKLIQQRSTDSADPIRLGLGEEGVSERTPSTSDVDVKDFSCSFLNELPEIVLRATMIAVPFLATDPFSRQICERHGFVFPVDLTPESVEPVVSRLLSLMESDQAPDDLIHVWREALLCCADPKGDRMGTFTLSLFNNQRFRDILGMNGIEAPNYFSTVVQCVHKMAEIFHAYDAIYALGEQATPQQVELKVFCDNLNESELFQHFFVALVEKFLVGMKSNSQ